jgi:hypothetical protein
MKRGFSQYIDPNSAKRRKLLNILTPVDSNVRLGASIKASKGGRHHGEGAGKRLEGTGGSHLDVVKSSLVKVGPATRDSCKKECILQKGVEAWL